MRNILEESNVYGAEWYLIQVLDFVEIAFFTCIAGMSVLGGFSTTIAMAKKKDPGWFAKVSNSLHNFILKMNRMIWYHLPRSFKIFHVSWFHNEALNWLEKFVLVLGDTFRQVQARAYGPRWFRTAFQSHWISASVSLGDCIYNNGCCLLLDFQGLAATREVHESGGSLAMRALARGSFYAVGGFTLFCLAAWKLSGVNSVS